MTTRKSKRAVVYLSNSLHYWQPGKVLVNPSEWFIADLSSNERTKAAKALKKLDEAIDKMTRNSKP